MATDRASSMLEGYAVSAPLPAAHPLVSSLPRRRLYG